MARNVLLAAYEVPGYGGASTASYRLLELLRASGLSVSFANLVDEQDAEFFPHVFGPTWGNPRALDRVENLVLQGPLYAAHPELARRIDELSPDVMIGVGFIAALLLKRASPGRRLIYLTSGCQQMKEALARGDVRDFLAVKREIDRGGLRRPTLTCREEFEAVNAADLVVLHSEMIRVLHEYYFPLHIPRMLDPILSFALWIHRDALEHAEHARPFDNRDIDLLFVASSWHRPEKNFPFVEQIAREMPGVNVHVVGELPTVHSNGVVMHGLITERKPLFELMGRARTLVCPSRFDAAPGVLFEASALGCNIVASENCGNWRICHPDLLARSFRARDFANAARTSLSKKYEDNIALFLDDTPYRELLETIDVL